MRTLGPVVNFLFSNPL